MVSGRLNKGIQMTLQKILLFKIKGFLHICGRTELKETFFSFMVSCFHKLKGELPKKKNYIVSILSTFVQRNRQKPVCHCPI